MSGLIRNGSAWLQTFSGEPFWPLDPRQDDVELVDIAHALSNLCRFGGQCVSFYSVGEHSVRVSLLVERYMRAADMPEHEVRHMALVGLLHDASEAYLVDMPRPIKLHMPQYLEIEKQLERVIAARFELTDTFPGLIKHCDDVILATEARDLCLPPPIPWEKRQEPLRNERIEIPCWTPTKARRRFEERFDALGGVR